ncbi:MAG: NAD(P)-binding domain-containing protein [Paracoccaceae bacterium]|nr:NAD(P)-binding domain-containing protein [Paracoccaceae bacterium]
MLDTRDNSARASAETWLAELDGCVSRKVADPGLLYLEECYWRDVLALTWRLQTFCGRDAVEAQLFPALFAAEASGFAFDPGGIPPQTVTRVGRQVVEAFFTFETRTGRCRGIVRLIPDDQGSHRAWTLSTELVEIKGHEEATGPRRPTGQSHSRDFRGPNWLDQRRESAAFCDRDPTVLVAGSGQAGLSIAARLGRLGVDTLVIDRHARIGDNWRLRYHALTLHNQVQVNHLPYMPFPPNWPTYIPKDKLAGWFEAYAEAMELNVWTGSELTGGTYDETAGHWTVTVKGSDGGTRTLRPCHLVMATGVSGIPVRPQIPGLDRFQGRVLHSSEYTDGEDWSDARAIVFGTGNSGHDIAQDLCSSGAQVTIVQRNPTLIVNIEPSAQLPYALYDEGPTLEQCDQIVVSMPVPLVREAHQDYTRQAREIDQPLLDQLEQKGFRLDFGEDGTGWQFMYLTRGGGYCFNVGCSEMIADGRIGLVQCDQIEGFDAEGAILKDGTKLPADLVILATGYKGQEALVAKLFGGDMAARVGPIWGFGDGEELRNMYCRTVQPGLWFIAGSLAQCRINSKFLALQIKAIEEGLLRPAV